MLTAAAANQGTTVLAKGLLLSTGPGRGFVLTVTGCWSGSVPDLGVLYGLQRDSVVHLCRGVLASSAGVVRRIAAVDLEKARVGSRMLAWSRVHA